VTRRFLRAIAVDDHHAAVERGCAVDEFAHDLRIVREQRHHERALAAIDEADRFDEAGVGHERRDGTERFDLVNAGCFQGGIAPEQCRSDEAAVHRTAVVDVNVPRRYNPRFLRKLELDDLLMNVVTLCGVDERAHRDAFSAWIADNDFGEGLFERDFGGIDHVGGHDGATNGGAFLARLHRHLAHDFLDEEVELRRAGCGVGAQHGGVQRIAFGDEAHAFARDDGVTLQLLGSFGGASERDDVLAGQVIEQVADGSEHELDCALRKHFRFDQHAEGGFGELCACGRRFDDRGHACEQRWRQFFKHAPDGEVEGVDVNGRAFQRRHHVLTDERALLRQTFDGAVDQDRIGGVRAASWRRRRTFRRRLRCRSSRRSSLHLCRRRERRARPAGQDRIAQGFEHPRAIVERQLAERGATDVARVGEGGCEVADRFTELRNRFARYGGADGRHRAARRDPGILRVGLKRIHEGLLSGR
jgi:hypothetical protein